jgi:hypothetical protein
MPGPNRYAPWEERSFPKEASETVYRGATLRHERMGHVNVSTAHGFYGGFPTHHAAREHVDELIRRAHTVCHRDGDGYRITIPDDVDSLTIDSPAPHPPRPLWG